MDHKIFSVVCKCWDKICCACTHIFPTPTIKNDLEEWKRIEGIDQYVKKRY